MKFLVLFYFRSELERIQEHEQEYKFSFLVGNTVKMYECWTK